VAARPSTTNDPLTAALAGILGSTAPLVPADELARIARDAIERHPGAAALAGAITQPWQGRARDLAALLAGRPGWPGYGTWATARLLARIQGHLQALGWRVEHAHSAPVWLLVPPSVEST
jgi:hypothetical protein